MPVTPILLTAAICGLRRNGSDPRVVACRSIPDFGSAAVGSWLMVILLVGQRFCSGRHRVGQWSAYLLPLGGRNVQAQNRFMEELNA